MLQSKLITLFRNFSKDELNRFEVFLASPYFNQSEKLLKFFRLIKHHQPLFDSPKLEKERLYKAMHGKSGYNDATMRQLISEMFKLAKTFLAHENLQKKELDASVLRFEWLFDHNIEKLANAEMEVRWALLDNCSQHDNYYYHHRWLHDLHKFELASEEARGAEHKLIKDFDVLAHVHSLNRDYLVNSFAMHIYLLSLTRIYKFSLNQDLLQPVEELAQPYINKGDAVIDIFFNIYQLLRTDEEKYFFELKARFLENDPTAPYVVMVEAGAAMENYCAKKLRGGEEKFAAEVMQVYRFEVENNFYMANGKMSYIYYFNVAIRGIETSELDWVEQFVENSKKYLPDEFREDSYNFAKAHVLFARKKYQNALRLALSCNISFFISKILIRNLVARIQYELGMLDELQVELDTHRHHLKDEKLTDERRQHLQTFITVMRHLGELKGNYNEEKLKNLSEQVGMQKGFANKKWFQEKIKELSQAKLRRG